MSTTIHPDLDGYPHTQNMSREMLVDALHNAITELALARSENRMLQRDKRRLDFLDECNRRLNEECGSSYGWELILSHNVTRLMMESPFMAERAGVDLHDSQVPAQAKKTCREAIDAKMKQNNLAP